MNRPLRRLAVMIFAVFVLLSAGLTYNQVIAGPRYRDDVRNARVVLDRAGRERGTIVSADGVVVAESVADPDDPRSFSRTYPQGEAYAHVVGLASPLLKDRGLEDAFTEVLTSGRDATISALLSALAGEDLRSRGIRLTINDGLQQTAIEAMAGQSGAVVAIEPSTGAVLAMVSLPSFDPNQLIGLEAAAAGAALEEDQTRPLLNRAIDETYAPGSTFKVVTAAAALLAGGAGPDTDYTNTAELELPGTTATIRNFDEGRCGSGERVTLQTAFALSCNTVFGVVGIETGPGDLVSTAEAFGFNSEIPFDLAVARSALPTADAFINDDPALAQTALGQRDVRSTPLQMALVASAVANSGVVMTPYLVSDIVNSDGEVVDITAPTEWQRAISPATARLLTGMMEQVVTGGTGTRAAVPGVKIAGKTGTAEVPGRPPHAWFVAFGPVDAGPGQRQIAVAVVVESGGDAGETATGGRVAAPIAQRLLAAWLTTGGG